MLLQEKAVFNSINKSSLASFTTNFMGILGIILGSVAPNRIHSMDLCSFNQYPNYLWLYAFHLYSSPCLQFFGLMVLCSRSKSLLPYLKRETVADVRSLFNR